MTSPDNPRSAWRRLVERRDGWFDGVGLTASMLCLIHCLALPILLAVLPIFAGALVRSERFHLWLLLLVVPATGLALLLGRIRHGTAWPLYLGLTGLMLIAGGTLAPSTVYGPTLAIIAGSLVVVAAHIANWRLRRMTALWDQWVQGGSAADQVDPLAN